MPRFNFNEIAMSGKADISKIQENFEEIEENGITEAEVDAKVGGQNQSYVITHQYYRVVCSLCRRGKIVTINVKWKINPGAENNSDGTPYVRPLPSWAVPSGQVYSDFDDAETGLLLYYNVVPSYNDNAQYDDNIKSSFSVYFGGGSMGAQTILWLPFHQNGANQYEYIHAISLSYIAAD